MFSAAVGGDEDGGEVAPYAGPRGYAPAMFDTRTRIGRINANSDRAARRPGCTKADKSYGFRGTDLARKVAIFHALGRLPELQLTHSFF